MQTHYTGEKLEQTIRDSLIRQEWEPEFAPPEGQFGRGGADPSTELKGFKKDAQSMIVQPLLSAFPKGGSAMDIGDKLTEIAYRQQNASAGAFARNMLLILRNRIAPDYLLQKAQSEFTGIQASELISELDQKLTSGDSKEIIDNLKIRIQSKTNITTDTLVKELKNIGDEYQHSGDDFLADESDLVRDEAKSIIKNHNNANKIQSLAQKWQADEKTWRNPLADKISVTKSHFIPEKPQKQTLKG